MTKFLPPKTTTVIRESATPITGEILYDQEKKKYYVGDGITVGGIPIAYEEVYDILTEDVHYTVATDGLESNDGLSISTPINIDRMVEIIENTYTAEYALYFHLKEGTYTEIIDEIPYVKNIIINNSRGNSIYIYGKEWVEAEPWDTSFEISPVNPETEVGEIEIKNTKGFVKIKDLKVEKLLVDGETKVDVENILFNPQNGFEDDLFTLKNKAYVNFINYIRISSSFNYFWNIDNNSYLNIENNTIFDALYEIYHQGGSVLYSIINFEDIIVNSGGSFNITNTSLQPDLATVAITGNYNDLINLPKTDGETFKITYVSTKIRIDGLGAGDVLLKQGRTYYFDVSHFSNTDRILRFSTIKNGTHNGGTEYTHYGITRVGDPGTEGSYIKFQIPYDAPDILYPYLTNVNNAGISTGSGFDTSFSIKLARFVAPPTTANSQGRTKDIAHDNNYFYVCVNTNTWLRTPLTTW